jgi:hypothetical protein
MKNLFMGRPNSAAKIELHPLECKLAQRRIELSSGFS